MVEIQMGMRERVEEVLFGIGEDREECDLILEIEYPDIRIPESGMDTGGRIRDIIEFRVKENFGEVDVEMGNPVIVNFKDNRADWESLQMLDRDIKVEYVNAFSDRIIDTQRDAIDKEFELYGEALTKINLFLKPSRNISKIANIRPRPKVVFELTYEMDKGIELRDIINDIKEFEDDQMPTRFAEYIPMEENNAIIIVPLRSIVEVDSFYFTEFDSGQIVSSVVEEMTGERIPSYRLIRAVVSCTMIGEI